MKQNKKIKRFIGALVALILCINMLPEMAWATEAKTEVSIGDTVLESGKLYIPDNDKGFGVKEKGEEETENYLEYTDGVLTVHGKVSIKQEENAHQALMHLKEGNLRVTGDEDSLLDLNGAKNAYPLVLVISDSNENGELSLGGSVNFKVAGMNQGGTLSAESGYSGNIEIRSNGSSSPLVYNTNLNLITTGDIILENTLGVVYKNVNQDDKLILKGNNVVIRTSNETMPAIETKELLIEAKKDVEISNEIEHAIVLNVKQRADITAGENVSITNEGKTNSSSMQVPAVNIEEANGGIFIKAGNNINIKSAYTAINGVLTVDQAENVTISGNSQTIQLNENSEINATGKVSITNKGGMAARMLTVKNASSVEIEGNTEGSIPCVSDVVFEDCSDVMITQKGNSNEVVYNLRANTPIKFKKEAENKIYCFIEDSNGIPKTYAYGSDIQKGVIFRKNNDPIPKEETIYPAGKGYMIFIPEKDGQPNRLVMNNLTSKGIVVEDAILEVKGNNSVEEIQGNVSFTGDGDLKTNRILTGNNAPMEQFTGKINGLVGIQNNEKKEIVFTVYGNAEADFLAAGNIPDELHNQSGVKYMLVIPQNTTLTIPKQGITYIFDTDAIQNNGTFINNGMVYLPVENPEADEEISQMIKGLNLSGTGLVYVQDKKDTQKPATKNYSNSGTKINVLNRDLDLENTQSEKGDLASDGYHWNNETHTLTLNNFMIEKGKTLTLPSDSPVKVITQEDSYVDRLDFSTQGLSDVTFQGKGKLTVNENISNGSKINVTIDNEAEVVASDGISIGISGGKDSEITVNGKLTAQSETNSAINAGKIKIGSSGVLNVSGKEGIKVNGSENYIQTMSYQSVSRVKQRNSSISPKLKDAFKIEEGGQFHANCDGYNIMVFSDSEEITDETKGQILVLPANYLPNGYSLHVISGLNGGQMQYAVTIAPENAVLTLKNEMIYGVSGTQLSLKKMENSGNNSTGGNESGNSNSNGNSENNNSNNGNSGNNNSNNDNKEENGKDNSNTDNENKGELPATDELETTYRKFRLRVPVSTKTKNKLVWEKVADADGYVIYGSKCNTKTKSYKIKQQVVLKNGNTTTWTDKNLKSGTYYKYYLKAYKLVNNKKVFIAKSRTVHATTMGGKYGNAKSVKVNKTDVTLRVGNKFILVAKEVKKDKKIQEHVTIKYESSNSKVATVDRKGIIKAKSKGNCYIYVYAQNGMYQKVTITVK